MIIMIMFLPNGSSLIKHTALAQQIMFLLLLLREQCAILGISVMTAFADQNDLLYKPASC